MQGKYREGKVSYSMSEESEKPFEVFRSEIQESDDRDSFTTEEPEHGSSEILMIKENLHWMIGGP